MPEVPSQALGYKVTDVTSWQGCPIGHAKVLCAITKVELVRNVINEPSPNQSCVKATTILVNCLILLAQAGARICFGHQCFRRTRCASAFRHIHIWLTSLTGSSPYNLLAICTSGPTWPAV
ncbi:Uncharacterized protein Fot_37727 [Forsythia ovata]|uniref:Uncharacterized protein n=1 Tax=Forsythia ovata TaxID=205694 RepID=A0ABD1RZT2_9LAMI